MTIDMLAVADEDLLFILRSTADRNWPSIEPLVVRAYCAGYTTTEIARSLGTIPSRVNTMLRRNYVVVRRKGPRLRPSMKRLLSKILFGDGCWEWTACRDADGYGCVHWKGSCQLAHRVMYESFVGPIPEDLELDHLCRNRGCVRPDHLEPVTQLTNQQRGLRATSEVCSKGHRFDEANTYRCRDGSRQCRRCNASAQRAYQRRRRSVR